MSSLPKPTGIRQPLLIVDDDEEIRTQMRWALNKEYDVLQAGDRSSAEDVFRARQPAVVLLDLGLPPHPNSPDEGLAILTDILVLDPHAKVVVISGQSEKSVTLRAVGAGAYDFFTKPVDMDLLKILLRRCFHVATLEREYRRVQHHFAGDDAFSGMLGTSPRMQTVFESIRKVATADASVLILGESGTGKEMVAQAIHQRSARRDGPFVAINCSAIPETLLESELFGHEKGAFTGAHMQRKGRIETAAAGTLFLDEVGEMPLPIQVKLLRFLQERVIERVGGREQIDVDTRVIAATNADLKKALATGTFREDLFYRLAVVQIALPALRDRDDDLRLLAQAFLQRFAAESGKTGLNFGPEALRALVRHAWPGNVRELQNRVRRAVIMGEGKRLTPVDLDLAGTSASGAATTLKEARETLERDLITAALKRHHGKITPAAVELGISRPTFYDLLNKLGLQKPEGEGG